MACRIFLQAGRLLLCGALLVLSPGGWAVDSAAGEISQEVALPAFPKPDNLIEFPVGPRFTLHVYVDAASISVQGDEIRLSHVVRTEGGASNISYDGVRCSEFQRAIYALGRQDGSWVRSRNRDWHPINASGVGGYFGVLTQELLCRDDAPAGNAAQLVTELKVQSKTPYGRPRDY